MAVFLLDISAESLHNMSEPNIFLHLFYINVILNKVQENIFFAVIIDGMKYYLKIIIPLFAFISVYSFLGILFGPKSLYAFRQLKRQRDILLNHVTSLSDRGEKLTIRIANLSSDPDTIAVYAHELGYVYKDEGLIKLMHFSGAVEPKEEAGDIYSIEKPRFLSDALCKGIALCAGLLVVACELLIIGRKDAYSEKRS